MHDTPEEKLSKEDVEILELLARANSQYANYLMLTSYGDISSFDAPVTQQQYSWETPLTLEIRMNK